MAMTNFSEQRLTELAGPHRTEQFRRARMVKYAHWYAKLRLLWSLVTALSLPSLRQYVSIARYPKDYDNTRKRCCRVDKRAAAGSISCGDFLEF